MIQCGTRDVRIQTFQVNESAVNEAGDSCATIRARLVIGIDLEVMAAMPEGEALALLQTLSAGDSELDGANTRKLTIKRPFPILAYTVSKNGKAAAEFTGRVVNAATVAIVDGEPSLVFTVESTIKVALLAKLGACVRRDDTTISAAEPAEISEARAA